MDQVWQNRVVSSESTTPETPKSSPADKRIRALIIPREHGAWGLLLVPLFTGVATGITSAQRIWPALVFFVAALALFWLRTPVEGLLGTSPLSARNARERRVALITSILLAAISATCLTALLWNGGNRELLPVGAVAALALILQAIVRRLGRNARMPAQLIGAIGLTSTAPAAYYIATGNLGERAIALWVANWLFAANQIHFVQVRIHAARATTFSEKFARGRLFFLAQPALVLGLGIASVFHWMPLLVTGAFILAVIRGTHWFFEKPRPLDIQRLGWSEMTQGVMFGILLAMAFIFS